MKAVQCYVYVEQHWGSKGLSVCKCHHQPLQSTDPMQASYNSLVQAKEGASSDLIHVIDGILAKFFPYKFGKGGRCSLVPPAITFMKERKSSMAFWQSSFPMDSEAKVGACLCQLH